MTNFYTGGVRGNALIQSSQYSLGITNGIVAESTGSTLQTTTSTSTGFVDTDKGKVNGSTAGSATGTTSTDSTLADNETYGLGSAYGGTQILGIGSFGGGFTAVPEANVTDTTPEVTQPFLPFIVLANPFETSSSSTGPAPGATGGFGLAAGAVDLYTDTTSEFFEATNAATTTGGLNFNSVTVASNEEGSAGGSGAGSIIGATKSDTSTNGPSDYAADTGSVENGFATYGSGVFGAPVTLTLPFAPVAIPTFP